MNRLAAGTWGGGSKALFARCPFSCLPLRLPLLRAPPSPSAQALCRLPVQTLITSACPHPSSNPVPRPPSPGHGCGCAEVESKVCGHFPQLLPRVVAAEEAGEVHAHTAWMGAMEARAEEHPPQMCGQSHHASHPHNTATHHPPTPTHTHGWLHAATHPHSMAAGSPTPHAPAEEVRGRGCAVPA